MASTVGTTGPVVVGGTLIYNDYPDIHAVDARTGDPVWTAQVFTNSFAAVRGHVLYVLGIADSTGLCAIDARTGSILWSFIPETDSYTSAALGRDVASWGRTRSSRTPSSTRWT